MNAQPPAAPAPVPTAHPLPGCFVALEGGDGAGKTTQRELLGGWLHSLGHEVVLTREPGGTELGQVLRDAVLHGGHVDPRTEALLYATDRAHHVHQLVLPALERGAVVVTDRYLDSSVAYQGAARDLGADEIRALSLWATEGLLPDLTVLLDLDPAVGAARRTGAPDRIERESAQFHRRVREHFLAQAGAEPDRYLVLDASRPPQELHAAVRARLAPLLPLVTAVPVADPADLPDVEVSR
ncbi:dTMP kinase [Georgenia sp. SYP-B2076]|uniref:dTMP kinase n=1 Tax=Georgenia sp. SYP-B2076 TaxID=2495881 RepID=UPI001F0C1B75|nr:dTMP kinase [Georgenia sp. SYP-B2076]